MNDKWQVPSIAAQATETKVPNTWVLKKDEKAIRLDNCVFDNQNPDMEYMGRFDGGERSLVINATETSNPVSIQTDACQVIPFRNLQNQRQLRSENKYVYPEIQEGWGESFWMTWNLCVLDHWVEGVGCKSPQQVNGWICNILHCKCVQWIHRW